MNRARDILKNQDGVSMIVAMVFYLVITLACITLFHVTSGAIKQSSNYRDAQLADIMAASLSQVVQQQIQEGVAVIPGINSDEKLQADGSDLIVAENDLAGYILENLGHSWSYYNEDQFLYADKNAATKILTLDGFGEIEATGQISMYWTSELENEVSGIYTERRLYATVTITVGNTSAAITSEFEMLGHSYQYADRSELSTEQYYWWHYNGEMK